MFSVLDDYLLKELPEDNAIHHILILADSGMGKTSFLLNYYAYNQKKRDSLRIALVPLGISNADEYIDKIENKNETVIFLDALDEDTKAIKDHRNRLSSLMKKCTLFKRVVITCRTQFFPSDEEIPKETGIVRVGDRKAGEFGVYTFNKLYLSPLSDNQVAIYLKNRFKWDRNKRKKGKLLIDKISNLKVRPMLLANIPDLIDNKAEIQYSFQLYEIMIYNWLKREKGWVKENDLRQFSEKLAFDLYINREHRGAEKIPKDVLSILAKKWNIPLDNWQLTGRSLLNRDAEGSYKFAHRSIMEFFFVVYFFKTEIDERSILEWTDQQKKFTVEYMKINHIKTNFKRDLAKADLSKIKLNNLDFTKANLKNINFSKSKLTNVTFKKANLVKAKFEESDLLEVDFSEAKMTGINFEKSSLKKAKGLPEWVKKGLNENEIYSQKFLISYIALNKFKNLEGEYLYGANLEGANLKGANFISTNLSRANLSRTNCSGTNFIEADLTSANLNDANLSNANLNKADLSRAYLKGKVNLSGSYLKRGNLKGVNLEGANLIGANLYKTNLSEAYLKGANLEGANLEGANLYKINLSEAYLKGANLSGVSLEEADLKGANCNSAIFREADLSGANLEGADFKGANLMVTNIAKAKVTGTNFEKTNFKKAKGLPEWVKKGLNENKILKYIIKNI